MKKENKIIGQNITGTLYIDLIKPIYNSKYVKITVEGYEKALEINLLK